MRTLGIFVLAVLAVVAWMTLLAGSMLACFALFGFDVGLFVWVGGMVVFCAGMIAAQAR